LKSKSKNKGRCNKKQRPYKLQNLPKPPQLNTLSPGEGIAFGMILLNSN
jgi:hypothetical protein